MSSPVHEWGAEGGEWPADEARQLGDAQGCAQQRLEQTEVRSGLRAHASSRGAREQTATAHTRRPGEPPCPPASAAMENGMVTSRPTQART